MTADTPDLELTRDAVREPVTATTKWGYDRVGVRRGRYRSRRRRATARRPHPTDDGDREPPRLGPRARLATAMAARSTGDLRTCIELATAVLTAGRATTIHDAVNIIATAALLARDELALRFAIARASHLQRRSPGHTSVADNAQHRLDLFPADTARRSYLAAADSPWWITNTTLWLNGREAIDAEQVISRSRRARPRTRRPTRTGVVAAITAAVTGDEDTWHTALRVAVEHNLQLIAVDALEGLATAAARTDNWICACGCSPPPNASATRPATGGGSDSNGRSAGATSCAQCRRRRTRPAQPPRRCSIRARSRVAASNEGSP